MYCSRNDLSDDDPAVEEGGIAGCVACCALFGIRIVWPWSLPRDWKRDEGGRWRWRERWSFGGAGSLSETQIHAEQKLA